MPGSFEKVGNTLVLRRGASAVRLGARAALVAPLAARFRYAVSDGAATTSAEVVINLPDNWPVPPVVTEPTPKPLPPSVTIPAGQSPVERDGCITVATPQGAATSAGEFFVTPTR